MKHSNIPEICESVIYAISHDEKPDSWRVTGFYKQHHHQPWKLVHCLREDAQVISIYSICGAIVMPHKVKRTRKLCWDGERLQHEREMVIIKANDDDALMSALPASKYLPFAPKQPSIEVTIGISLARYVPCAHTRAWRNWRQYLKRKKREQIQWEKLHGGGR